MSKPEVDAAKSQILAAADEIGRAIVGKDHVVKLILSSLLAKGHVLIEDVPGVGKTTLAKAVATTLGCQFNRIQFTPDMLPSDILGTSIFNQQTHEFEFRPGPIFSNIVLADEINRTTPKTQSALLECMEERQVTADGVTRLLPSPFLVIATQNNVERGSTYPLPEAQMDRFFIRVSVGYPMHQDEVTILGNQMTEQPLQSLHAILSKDELAGMQEAVKQVHIDDSLRDYIVSITAKTRQRPDVILGVSPRGSLAMMQMSRAWAALSGRDYVVPDDIKTIAIPVLAHRLLLADEYWNTDAAVHIIEDVLTTTPVPVDYAAKH